MSKDVDSMDVIKNLKVIIGDQAVQMATQKAYIEKLEAELQKNKTKE